MDKVEVVESKEKPIEKQRVKNSQPDAPVSRRNFLIKLRDVVLGSAVLSAGGGLGWLATKDTDDASIKKRLLQQSTPSPKVTPLPNKGKEAVFVQNKVPDVVQTAESAKRSQPTGLYTAEEKAALEARLEQEKNLVKSDKEKLLACKAYSKLVSEALWEYEFSKEFRESNIPSLLPALIFVESRGDPTRGSGAGAQGLCQIMPKTAEYLAKELGLQSYDIKDEKTNITFALKYLDSLYSLFGREDITLLAYNLGQGNVADIINAKLGLGYSEEDREKILLMSKDLISENGLNYENLIETDFVKSQIERFEQTGGEEGFNDEPLHYVPRILAAYEMMASKESGAISRRNLLSSIFKKAA